METIESVEMILHPLPSVAEHVIETCLGGWVVVHRLDREEMITISSNSLKQATLYKINVSKITRSLIADIFKLFPGLTKSREKNHSQPTNANLFQGILSKTNIFFRPKKIKVIPTYLLP